MTTVGVIGQIIPRKRVTHQCSTIHGGRYLVDALNLVTDGLNLATETTLLSMLEYLEKSLLAFTGILSCLRGDCITMSGTNILEKDTH